MSQENVETFKRASDAYNSRDVEAVLKTLDPEIEWHSAIMVPLRGEAAAAARLGCTPVCTPVVPH